jgi:nucleoid-associated protein
MVNLKSIVVHQINKDRGGVATLIPRDSLLPISETEIQFVSNVTDVYYKKSNPIYGIFNANSISFPYQTMLQRYLNEEGDFLSFTIDAMEHFKNIINDVPQATGGYIVFAHFENGQNFVMTIMLNNKRQYNINNSLIIEEIFSLNIEKLDVANFININRWEDNSETYLSFARGKKDVSNYFKKFIGCTDQISAKEQSQRLKRAFFAFIETLPLNNTEKEDKRNQVYNYCLEKIKRNEEISLSHVSSLLDNENPESFKEFASGEEYQVNSTIKGHKPSLKSLKFFVYRSKELTIEFDSALLDNRISYDRAQNELLIKNIPDDLRHQILNLPENNEE